MIKKNACLTWQCKTFANRCPANILRHSACYWISTFLIYHHLTVVKCSVAWKKELTPKVCWPFTCFRKVAQNDTKSVKKTQTLIFLGTIPPKVSLLLEKWPQMTLNQSQKPQTLIFLGTEVCWPFICFGKVLQNDTKSVTEVTDFDFSM